MDFPISTLILMLAPPVGVVLAIILGVIFIRCLFSKSAYC